MVALQSVGAFNAEGIIMAHSMPRLPMVTFSGMRSTGSLVGRNPFVSKSVVSLGFTKLKSHRPVVSVLAPPPPPKPASQSSRRRNLPSNGVEVRPAVDARQQPLRPSPVANPYPGPVNGLENKAGEKQQSSKRNSAESGNGAPTSPRPSMARPNADKIPSERAGDTSKGVVIPKRPQGEGVSLDAENGAAVEAPPQPKKKSWKSIFKFWDSSLAEHQRPLPLPMTYPDTDPYPPEVVEQALRCDPAKKDCKEVVYTWTDECSKCQGTGLVSYNRRKGKEVIYTCISCHGVGAVQRITARSDTKRKKEL